MIGINLSGAEFGSGIGGTNGTQYHWTTLSELQFYQSKGVDLIRVPFTWERMQPTLGGPLSATELGYLKTLLANAASLGMDVIIDCHNYGRYNGQPFGASGGPTAAQFADFWTKLANEVKGYGSLVGYDLMNEPHDMPSPSAWKNAAQAAVDSIRTVDTSKTIFVEGNGWSGAWSWQQINADFIINDPANKLVYQAHQYFDRNSSGTYAGSYDQEGAYAMVGVDRMKPFVDWLNQHGFKGMIGEFGAPSNDARWLEVTKNAVDYMNANGLIGTAWGGGTWWPSNYSMFMGAPGQTDSGYLNLLEGYFTPWSSSAGSSAPAPAPTPTPTLTPPPASVMGWIEGTVRADQLQGTANAEGIRGLDGNDTIDGRAGGDIIDGGNGFDTISYGNSSAAVDADLTRGSQLGGDAAGDILTGIEAITGSSWDDILRGNGASNTLDGGAGADMLEGRGGADTLNGGTGIDTASYAGSGALVDVNLYRSSQLGGDAAGDKLVSIENIIGSRFGDRITGSGAANLLDGGAGDDWLNGSWGADTLKGGTGRDRFIFDSVGNAKGDRVLDFNGAEDKLDFGTIDANTKMSGNQAFTWIGTKGFTGSAGQLRTYSDGSSTYVAGDVNGDGVADFSVALNGTIGLMSSHFYL
ncbi:cellulase family glycosylhydrolase [Sphingomonas sp. LHG3406-1]|uniref:cellulase family glycosylhydrolase n=1 Tax=Sphingomonas sp. LHG3406-1 TaxID=2804617 RepID=UPI002608DF02|nr:cellulase family glycosylhydrolase [Sphingomonas sp. LHG3406-1]